MVTRRLSELLLAFAMLPVLVQPALAHVFWFGDQGEDIPLLFGHPEEGEGAAEPYDPAAVKEITAYDLERADVPIEIKTRTDGIAVVPKANIAALSAFADEGFYIRTPNGDYESISDQEAQGNPEATGYPQYAKSLYGWSETLSQPFGLSLEIMPLQNPLEVMAGETLPIQVLYQGNLIDDAKVEYLGKVLKFNQEGVAYVPVDQRGLEVIEASYTDPTASSPGFIYSTSFTAVPEPSPLLGIGAFGLLVFARKQLRRVKLSKPIIAPDNKSA